LQSVLGIDIGGTKILGGVILKTGELLKEVKVNSEASFGRDRLLINLFKCIDDLMREDILGIGVCTPGFVNSNTGIVEYAGGNMPGLTGCALKSILETRYKIPVVVENDANAAAIGEGFIGSAQSVNNFTMISLGTGIGGAIVVNGKLTRGHSFCAGEFGHSILVPGGKDCSCGEKGCLEMYASGTAIYKRYNELCGHNKTSGAIEVFDLLKQNDILAHQVIHEFEFYISIILKNITRYIDPELIIIGGGLIDARELWWDNLLKLIPKSLLIVPAKLGNHAAMFGAAKLSLYKLQ